MRLYAIKYSAIALEKLLVYTDIRVATQVLAYLVTHARLAESAVDVDAALSRSEVQNEFMIACRIAYKKFEPELLKYTSLIENAQELFDYYLTLGHLTCECSDPRQILKSYPLLEDIDAYTTATIVSFDVSRERVVEVIPNQVYEIDTQSIPAQARFEKDAYLCLVDNYNKTKTESFSPYIGANL